MKLSNKNLKLLGLSPKEIKVLDALIIGNTTPLAIYWFTEISRPAIYEILARLKSRGLIGSYIKDGKTYWRMARNRDIEETIYEAKRQLLGIEEGVEEVRGASDATVIVHRGASAIRALLSSLFKDNKEQKLYAMQGDVVDIGWNKIFGVEGINEINQLIKKNRIITEGIIPEGWFERQFKLLGEEWAEEFVGRAAITHEIEERYFKHGGQVFVFKDSLYLIAMNEEIIIEIRNSEIQKLILAMFRFIEDNSKKIDVNSVLRQLIGTENISD